VDESPDSPRHCDEHVGDGVMGAMPIWAACYLSFMVPLFWYAAAQPWQLPYVRPY
jgi:hypothetical protein